MSKPVDDLDAVRQISEVLSAFDDEDDRKRILRWACEKTNTGVEFTPPLPAVASTPPPSGAPAVPGGVVDIKTFVESSSQPPTCTLRRRWPSTISLSRQRTDAKP